MASTKDEASTDSDSFAQLLGLFGALASQVREIVHRVNKIDNSQKYRDQGGSDELTKGKGTLQSKIMKY